MCGEVKHSIGVHSSKCQLSRPFHDMTQAAKKDDISKIGLSAPLCQWTCQAQKNYLRTENKTMFYSIKINAHVRDSTQIHKSCLYALSSTVYLKLLLDGGRGGYDAHFSASRCFVCVNFNWSAQSDTSYYCTTVWCVAPMYSDMQSLLVCCGKMISISHCTFVTCVHPVR